MAARLLIIEDDLFLQANLRKLLEQDGYSVLVAGSGEEGMALVAESPPDLVILDLGLPGDDGISTCRRLRQRHTMPVIMLTARTDALDKVIGLEVGADDYLTKPFEPSELRARIRAQLRRNREYQEQGKATSELVILGGLLIDFARRDVLRDGQPCELTSKEFEIIVYLHKHLGLPVEKDTLFEKVWGYEMDFNSNSLEVYIYRIRRKMERDPSKPQYLHTLRGYGYKLVDPAATD